MGLTTNYPLFIVSNMQELIIIKIRRSYVIQSSFKTISLNSDKLISFPLTSYFAHFLNALIYSFKSFTFIGSFINFYINSSMYFSTSPFMLKLYSSDNSLVFPFITLLILSFFMLMYKMLKQTFSLSRKFL